MSNSLKIIISGGGTGGHIFPALSIADEIKQRFPNCEILFVGALGRMEMERVPAAGYKITGLPVSGFRRSLTLKNIGVIFNLFRSLLKAQKIIKSFKPNVVIGVGGYASGPVLRSAARKKIPTLLQEQNGYAGVTNRLLAKKANTICVAYKGMEKYFPAHKMVLTGNPVRNIKLSAALKKEAYQHFNLQPGMPVLLVVGGSLGARTINEAMAKSISFILQKKIQVIWQTGKYYFDEMKNRVNNSTPMLQLMPFISRMDLAYNVADLVISRAGAISISEICLTGKASILVPSPNVAEDHQTKNARALEKEDAAMLIPDKDAQGTLGDKAIELLHNPEKLKTLSLNSKRMAQPEAVKLIVNEVEKLIAIQV